MIYFDKPLLDQGNPQTISQDFFIILILLIPHFYIRLKHFQGLIITVTFAFTKDIFLTTLFSRHTNQSNLNIFITNQFHEKLC